MPIKAEAFLGYHTMKTARDSELTSGPEENEIDYALNGSQINRVNVVRDYNAQQFFGYVPGAGIITGTRRIIAAISGDMGSGNKLTPGTRVLLIVRGILEILGLGLLFLIPDLVASGIRAKDMKNYTYL